MKHFLLAGICALSFSAHAQYCTTGGPTSTVDSQVMFVRLVGQNDSIRYTHPCPGVTGVQNLTNLSTSLVAGNNYQLSVQFGTCNGNYAGCGQAWIDFDRNDVFDPTESIGTWQGIPPVALSTWTFPVPMMAQNGATRMRVIQQEAAQSLPLNPCASFTWGSVMDFTINISGGVDCSAYPGDESSDAIPVTSLPYSHSWNSSYCYSNDNFVYPASDVYYLVTPSAQTAFIRASLCGSSYDTYISAIDPQGNVLAYNDDYQSCSPQSEILIPCQGVDSVYIIVEGWGTASGNYILNLTEDMVGMDEFSSQSRQTLFPNPATDNFTVPEMRNVNVTVYNVAGESVLTLLNYQGGAINVSGLADGVYTVECSTGEKKNIQKLVIAR